jgi:HAD superfamily hydrolase (TIGR01509 family)
LDGTVVDSEPAWFKAEHILVERYGGSWSDEQSRRLIGADLNDTAAVLQRAGVALETAALVNALLDIVIAYVSEHQPWRPGVTEALAACRAEGLDCALVSMSWRRFTSAVAQMLPEAFSVIVSGDDVSRGKPDPEAYQLGAAKLGLEPRQCVAVEDSPTGVASALAAGVPTIAVPDLAVVEPAPGLVIVDSVRELSPDRLRSLHQQILENQAPGRQTAGSAAGTSTNRTRVL